MTLILNLNYTTGICGAPIAPLPVTPVTWDLQWRRPRGLEPKVYRSGEHRIHDFQILASQVMAFQRPRL